MAARTRRPLHDENTKAKIQASQLINRLQNHALGAIEMSPTQIRAAEILLRKSMPDLSAVQQQLEVTTRNVVALPEPDASVDAWKAGVSARH